MKVYTLRAWAYDGGGHTDFVCATSTTRDDFLRAVIDSIEDCSQHGRMCTLGDFVDRSPAFDRAMAARGCVRVVSDGEVTMYQDADTEHRGPDCTGSETDHILDTLSERGVEIRTRWR